MSHLRQRLSAAALLPLLLLNASCGGGDGGASSVPVVAAPTPTPTPTPAPSATPTPTPTFVYGTFDLAVDRSLVGQLVTVRTTERYVSDTAPFYAIESQDAELRSVRNAAEWDYRASRSIIVRLPSEEVSLTAADVSRSDANGVEWRRPLVGSTRGDAAVLARLAPNEYVYVATQEAREDVRTPGTSAAFRDTTRYGLLGERTRDGDAPTAGTTSYTALLTTSPVARNRGGGFTVFDTPTIVVDHATGQVSARFNAIQSSYVTGTEPARATLVFTGTLTAGGLAGTITSPDTGYTGSFAGDLFGPRAVEIGLVFTLSRPDGDRAAGRLFGRRR